MSLSFGTQRLLHREGKSITSVWDLLSTGLFEGDIYFIAHTLVGSKPLSAIKSWDGVEIAEEGCGRKQRFRSCIGLDRL